MNHNLRFDSIKKCELFAITVPQTEISKDHAFESLNDFSKQLLVCQERHMDGSLHHHIFIRTVDKFAVSEMKEMLDIIYTDHLPYPNQLAQRNEQLANREENFIDPYFNRAYAQSRTIHVSTVKNLQSWLNYITKEDVDPRVKNISLNQLSFYNQVKEWAEQTPIFRADDPFVFKRPSLFKLLKETHEAVRLSMKIENIRQMRAYEQLPDDDELNEWQEKIVDWWNDWILNGWRHKKPQLYLYGKSNTGKTTFVTQLLSRCIETAANDEDDYLDYVFTPIPNDKRFGYQGFDRQLHKCALVDEFDILQYDASLLKKFMAGEPFMSDVKGSKAIRVVAKIPMILISNNSPPTREQNTNYEGILTRLNVVCSDDVEMLEEV